MSLKIYSITPVPKPRLTSMGKYSPRAKKYYAWAEHVRLLKIVVPESGAHIRFCLPMPKSWSIKKKSVWAGMPHQQTPDIDNLIKALLDAIYKDDSHIWDIRASKVWAYDGKIEVRRYNVSNP